ncbi:hypothetical protein M378DRAFT_30506, partial [Amanita muscaria Koide BX008]
LSDEAKAKLQQAWKHCEYLIIDEYSMIAKSFLALMSRNISIAKEGSDSHYPDHSFGGVNVILCGDLHQFPPVAQPAAESLFRPINLASDSADCQLGRVIYEEFSAVVILREQMRVTDPVWQDFLHHLRYGRVQERHMQIVQSLIISNPTAIVDFGEDPWSSASLVTPCHAVRKAWNNASVRYCCAETGRQLYICTADDTIGGQDLTWSERYAVAGRGKSDKRRKNKDLPWKLELAEGMKLMVTDNVETDLDVTNRARGELIGIVLHPEEPEPPAAEASIINLQWLP